MPVVVCMGVSGVGKTTVAQALAGRLGGTFLDADDFHPAGNKRKMAQGIPLDDADREGWLATLNHELRRRTQAAAPPVFLACSALKRTYRARLCQDLHDRCTFVYLKAPYEAVRARLAARTGHFMPPSLLASQFAALEEPEPGTALIADAQEPLPALLDRVTAALHASAAR